MQAEGKFWPTYIMKNSEKLLNRILITRQPEQSAEFVNLLSSRGLYPFILPMIETVPVECEIKNKVFDYLIFTSSNAFNYFKKYINSIKFGKIAAVGKKTAEAIEREGFDVNLIPEDYSGEGLVKKFMNREINGMKFLIPGPKKTSNTLKNFLVSKKAIVESPVVYETIGIQYPRGFISGFIQGNLIDCITFASPSAARSFLSQTKIPDTVKETVVIGRTTFSYLQENGINAVYPNKYTVNDMVELICKINDEKNKLSGGTL